MKLHEIKDILPMDKESRLARAREMGFDTNIMLYHGTSPRGGWTGNDETPDIKAFNISGGKIAGVYLTKSSAYSNKYTKHDGKEVGAVYPVFVRGNIATADDVNAIWEPGLSADNITRILQNKGFDVVNDEGMDEVIVFDPKNIRSIHAKFDPNKSSSSNISESIEPEIEDYAVKHGLGDVSWEGSGDMGHAYITDKETILKTTRDTTELEYARMLVGKKLHNVVDIYDVFDNVIHMEYLDTDGIEDLHSAAMEYAEYNDLTEIDPDDHEDMSEDIKKFVNDISYGAFELQRNGVYNLDLKYNNIGQKSNGNYAIFDMSSKKRRD